MHDAVDHAHLDLTGGSGAHIKHAREGKHTWEH